MPSDNFPENDELLSAVPSVKLTDGTYRHFIENLPAMFYAVAPSPPHVPLYISPTFEIFGYPIADWYTKSDIWDRIIHPADQEMTLKTTREAMREGRNVDLEYRVNCKDGRTLWVRDRSCFIRDGKGNPLCWQGVMMDITERREAMLELQKRENLYRKLASIIPQTAVLLFDHDFRYTLAEGEQLPKHGWATETFENKTLWEVFPEEISGEWSDYYTRALGGEEISFQTDNEDGAFQVDVRPVRDEDGSIFAGMVMWQDVTQSKRATDALRESETRYRRLFENANDIIYVHDLDGNYLSINEAGLKLFGYTLDEVLGLNMSNIAAPGHLEIASAQLNAKISGNSQQTVYELDCITKSGARATLEVNSSVIVVDDVPVAVQGVARDITDRRKTEEALRQSEARFRDLFENANDLIYTHDLEGNFTSLNRAGERITGYTREEALKMNIAEVVAPEFLRAAKTMTARKLAEDVPTTYETEIVSKDGRRVSLELSTRLIVADGLPIGVQGIGRDITERLSAERSLLNTLSLFSTTFESTADGIVVMSLDREIVTCNKKFIEMWGVDQAIIDTQDGPRLVKHVADQLTNTDEFLQKLDEVYLNEGAVATEILTLKDGRIFERISQPQLLEGRPIGRVASFRDITERSQAEEKLRHYALHDPLTDLPNRVQFMTHLQNAIDRAKGSPHSRFAVLFLDLDRFKVVNDSLGHVVGDQLLIAIGDRLTACVRPGDVVARLGGDEFVVLLNRTGEPEEIERVAERLQTRISAPFRINNYEVFTTASIGIILSSDLERRADEFLRDADAAMYRAKESGKARYEVFDREMHARNLNLLQIETDLRHALDRNEFEVAYQPIVNLDDGTIKEFEALLRWRHPENGLVGPDQFVSVAEETGLIVPIGRWILQKACEQTAIWREKFATPLTISVNLSAKQLMHPSLVEQTKTVLLDTGLDPRHLKLEVTESNVMDHSEKSLSVLNELSKLGISLSTDDFGTGYSSLSYLQQFPFDRLKIDRSFVKRLGDDEKTVAIVKTILMLGENLGIEVVAEGVETTAHLDTLRMLGCRLGQGYLFSRPLDPQDAADILKEGLTDFARPITPDALYLDNDHAIA